MIREHRSREPNVMRISIFLWLTLLLSGCNESLYLEGTALPSWPNTLTPRYSVSIGTDSQVFLINHTTSQKEALPFFARKFSRPDAEKIRFSKDGHYLLVPIIKDALTPDGNDYYLAIWDIEKHAAIREIQIQRELIGR